MNGAFFSFSRWLGIVGKEFIQLKRDRLTFAMIVGIPVVQLVMFGYAINSDPKRLSLYRVSMYRRRTASCSGPFTQISCGPLPLS